MLCFGIRGLQMQNLLSSSVGGRDIVAAPFSYPLPYFLSPSQDFKRCYSYQCTAVFYGGWHAERRNRRITTMMSRYNFSPQSVAHKSLEQKATKVTAD